MTTLKSITMTLAIAATALTAMAPLAQAAGQPNLKPAFSTKTGKVTVKNVGGGDAGRSLATVHCQKVGGGGCADPTPAQIAPYENPAYPNKAVIKFGPVPGNSKKSHTFPFYAGLTWDPGNYIFTVCVDAGDHVAESNERDNCKRYRMRVKPNSVTPPRRLNLKSGS